MGYLHIDNLYKSQTVLLFKECYALEKIHGTSAHVSLKMENGNPKVGYFSGGEKYERFIQLFNDDVLIEKFMDLGHESVIVFGEAYGGKQQGMRDTYGNDLKFIAFDVKIGEHWLSVPDMEQVAVYLGLEVVAYNRGPATVEWLDQQRDLPSVQAARNGCGVDKLREGVVIRPLQEFKTNNGERVIAKHKGDAFAERVHTPKVKKGDLEVLKEANAIAQEWVTPMRLTHVLDKLPQGLGVENTKEVITAVLKDVEREGAGEISWSREAKKAVSKRAAKLFQARIKERLYAGKC